MQIAFVVLYLTFGSSSTVEVPQHFKTMEECQATYEAVKLKTSSRLPWVKPESSIPMGSCVPIMVNP
jgi:hypothetical protein